MSETSPPVGATYVCHTMDKWFTHKVVDIDPGLLRQLQDEVARVEDWALDAVEQPVFARTEGSNLPPFLPQILGKILALGSFIKVIDPLGETYSGSLTEEWHDATWINGGRPENNEEQWQQLFQLIAVMKGVALSGKARVVTNKGLLRDGALGIRSVFAVGEVAPQDELVFVCMPFSEQWSDYIWKRQLKPIVESIPGKNLTCKRADDLYGRDVMLDVFKSLVAASVVIADMTTRNPNVFYELGIAHALGKDVILLAQSSGDIPFDLSRFRTCVYSNDGPGYEKLQSFLPPAITEILGGQKLREASG